MKGRPECPPWTHEQRDHVRKAFSPRRQKSQRIEVGKFIEFVETFANVLAHTDFRTDSEVTAQLQRAHEHSSELAKSLESLSADARSRIVLAGPLRGWAWGEEVARDTKKAAKVKGIFADNPRKYVAALKAQVAASRAENAALKRRLAAHEKDPGITGADHGRNWNSQNLFVQQIERDARELSRDIVYALGGINRSRGSRPVDRAAQFLAAYMYQSWLLSFGTTGSAVADSEFHRVAKAVAAQYRLKVGPNTLEKAKADAEAVGSRPAPLST
jgi:hypothetical protein